ncbi:RNA polymerase sigma factor [Candidatus Obscuribacterales bacterium]|nr:RNA polymerase sigma factor [Candidatus Obscuribacterales bacterium]MBX3153424.1 RNA polymerase sigma factor [Candidatus Obscuribacterales bacterium]
MYLKQDEALLEALKGERIEREQAFSQLRLKLIKSMGPKLKSTYQVDDSFVDDVVQETLIVIVKKLNTFRGQSAFFTWVCSIAVRLALGELRRKRWSDFSLDGLTADSVFEIPDTAGDFTENLAVKEISDSVKSSIMTALTEKQRTALLAELEGMTTDEIARRYDSTRGAIYKLTHDARRALIKDLRKKGFDLEETL